MIEIGIALRRFFIPFNVLSSNAPVLVTVLGVELGQLLAIRWSGMETSC